MRDRIRQIITSAVDAVEGRDPQKLADAMNLVRDFGDEIFSPEEIASLEAKITAFWAGGDLGHFFASAVIKADQLRSEATPAAEKAPE